MRYGLGFGFRLFGWDVCVFEVVGANDVAAALVILGEATVGVTAHGFAFARFAPWVINDDVATGWILDHFYGDFFVVDISLFGWLEEAVKRFVGHWIVVAVVGFDLLWVGG